MRSIKEIAAKNVFKTAFGKKLRFDIELYYQYKRKYSISKKKFLLKNFNKIYVQKACKRKSLQIARFLKHLDIVPVENESFFYSIDCFKRLEQKGKIFDNYTIDYSQVIEGNLRDDVSPVVEYEDKRQEIVCALHKYIERAAVNETLFKQYHDGIVACRSIFQRPANSFFEGLQRILFINQFLWQTGHKLNGLGRLDMILFDLYKQDVECGKITRQKARNLLKNFFKVLHEYYWYKSSSLVGDTGQIIVLGGLNQDGQYECNDLTRMFIEVSMEMKLPDPKVLLRCASNMPDDLLELALQCIATGIGAPLLSNDDSVIPNLIGFGYTKEDSYNHVTSACWEPLIAGASCDQNNIKTLNFATALICMLEEERLQNIVSFEMFVETYERYLKKYIRQALTELLAVDFEEAPLYSLFSKISLQEGKDLVCGGARYAHMGLTSVAMGCVVNSLLNLKKCVFDSGDYTLEQIDKNRRENYENNVDLLMRLKALYPCYGSDAAYVVELTNRIMLCASREIEKYKTKWGGNFKFGLSSPNYIVDAKNTPATFDGRKDGDPFATHISCDLALPITELMRFGMQLDYSKNRFNGNVLDFFVTPDFLKKNQEKYKQLLRACFSNGLYQLQMNVVDSKTLIAAKENPDLFPNLVVRVWGFSAYFNDLPEEYKELLIKRALESEKAV